MKKMVAGHVIAVTVGAGAAVLMAPVALGMIGFTAGGIVAGSTAASLMSTAAVANGGGVAAGGLVACLQSAAAAGLSGTATVALGSLGAATGEGMRWLSSKIWK